MIVYKILIEKDGRLFSSNKGSESADCLKSFVVQYKKDTDNTGIIIEGEQSLLFAFSSEEAAREWIQGSHLIYSRYGEKNRVKLWKCWGTNISRLIVPVDPVKFNSTKFLEKAKDYWKDVAICRKQKKSINKLLDRYRESIIPDYKSDNFVACEKIRLLEELKLSPLDF